MVFWPVFDFRGLWFRGFGFGLFGVVSVSLHVVVSAWFWVLVD